MSPKEQYSGGGAPLGESKGRVQWGAHWVGAKEGYGGGGGSIRRVQREGTGGGVHLR